MVVPGDPRTAYLIGPGFSLLHLVMPVVGVLASTPRARNPNASHWARFCTRSPNSRLSIAHSRRSWT